MVKAIDRKKKKVKFCDRVRLETKTIKSIIYR